MEWGTKKVPKNRLPSLIGDVKTIYSRFGDKEIDHETISSLLGYSSKKSGTYMQKIADMRSFNLIEPRGNVKVTEIGRKVSYSNNLREEQEGLIQAIKSIELWKLIFEKYTKKGLRLSSNFWTDIQKWTKLPPEKAKIAAENIKKAYLEDIKYIKPEGVKVEEKPEIGITTQKVPARLISVDYGTLNILDEGSVDAARKLLDLIEAKLKAKGTKKE